MVWLGHRCALSSSDQAGRQCLLSRRGRRLFRWMEGCMGARVNGWLDAAQADVWLDGWLFGRMGSKCWMLAFCPSLPSVH